MRFHYISDLHLEFGYAPELPGGDVLLIAGDTIPVASLNFDKSAHDLGRYSINCERFSDLMEETRKYQQTFMILGNHEHYGNIFQESYNDFLKVLPDSVKLLENEVVELSPNLKLFGATLWTDYDSYDPKNLDTARLSMNDHHLIRERVSDGVYRFNPESAYATNKLSRNNLAQIVRDNPDDKFIVMTHHTPSMLCGNEKWGGPQNRLNYAFHNTKLEDFIFWNKNVIHWVCGHTHDPFDGYIHQCAVHINPRGYMSRSGKPENREFDVNRSFEVNI
jgi:hypothetical protein